IRWAGGLALLAAVMLSGCATTVAFDVLKPAQVNMSDYRKLAVLEYEPYELSDEYYAGKLIVEFLFGTSEIRTSGYRFNLDEDIAEYMTEQTIRTLSDTGYFTIVTPDRVQHHQGYSSGSMVSNRVLSEQLGVDAVLVGTILDMDYDERVENRNVTIKNDDGDSVPGVESYFVQQVEMQVNYNVIDVDTGNVIASKYLSGNNSRRTKIEPEEADDFRAPQLETLYRAIIRDFQPEISRQLAPYYEREYRRLKEEKGNDKFEAAEKLIKSSQYKKALDLYLELWYDSEILAAGYNAAILYEVMGQYDSALSLMKEVHDTTGNPDAYQQYLRLQQVSREADEAKQQL
ncbi:MAG: DUF6340 family protein, partial [Spirochaetota bacterium]